MRFNIGSSDSLSSQLLAANERVKWVDRATCNKLLFILLM